MPQIALGNMPFAAPLVAAVALAAAVVLAVGLARGKGMRYALWAGLGINLAVIAVLTLGSMVTGQPHGAQGVSLVPFQEIERGLNNRGSVAWVNLVGNIAMFVPVGLAIAALARGDFWARLMLATVCGSVLSTSIELIQYTGGRVADIDDIILNTAGTLVGGVLGAAMGAVGERRRSRRAHEASASQDRGEPYAGA